MTTPQFIAEHSTFFENIFENRFLHDLAKVLVMRDEPILLNILRADVDMFGFDLVLSVNGRATHVQMKTRSGRPANSPYRISDELWNAERAGVIWLRYDQETLEPLDYYLFGFPLPTLTNCRQADRRGYRHIWMRNANHRGISLEELAGILFPVT